MPESRDAFRGAAPERSEVDVAVVGAGFAGLYQLHRLRQAGLRVVVLEAAPSVGGTWYWNRYPGARCDVHSLDYSYSFSAELEAEWQWSEKYATQPEILRYLEHVADRFDLRPDIRLGTRVVRAEFDDDRWLLTTDGGHTVDAQFAVMATGCLSASRVPDVPGLHRFTGSWHHTADWPHEGVDVHGRRVGVIGTGSSGVQVIPELARDAGRLTVFQRTPTYALPASNRPLTDEERSDERHRSAGRRSRARDSRFGLDIPDPTENALDVGRAERIAAYDERWEAGQVSGLMLTYRDLLTSRAANDTVAEFARGKIRSLIADPVTAEILTPRGYPFGAKRPCLGSGYFETFNAPHVEIVDVASTPIVEVTPDGIRTAEAEFELDTIVFATGFDAMTGALAAIDIRGRGGRALRDHWASGPRTYLGLAVDGFPNLFLMTGPGSPSVLSNMVVAIEQHVEWITDCVSRVRALRAPVIEATPEAVDDWVEHVNAVAAPTLYPEGNSWYLGANVPGKPRVFMPYVRGLKAYTRRCDDVAASGYAGFTVGVATPSDRDPEPEAVES